MTAKGSSSASCCCTQCETMPYTVAFPGDIPQDFPPGQRFSFSGNPIDFVQGFCCQCLPSYACVTLICDPGSQSSSASSSQSASASASVSSSGSDEDYEFTKAYIPIICGKGNLTDAMADVYVGTVYFRGIGYTAYFTLDVTEDRKCMFCLEIPDMGFEKQCVEITVEHQQFPLMWCKTLTYSIDELGERQPTTFTGSTYYCDELTVKITTLSVTAITGRPAQMRDEYGLIGPAYEVGAIYRDDNSLRNRCRGCGCISIYGCLTVYRVGDGTSESHHMVLGCENCIECPTGHIYSSVFSSGSGSGSASASTSASASASDDYDGPLVSIEKDPGCDQLSPDCACYLKLIQISSTEVFDVFSESPIVKGVDPGECPFPSYKWTVQDVNNNSVLVDFRTEACNEEPCQITMSGCCVGVDMPAVIHVTIERTGGTSPSSCDCLPITIPMLFDGSPISPAWTGRLDNVPGNGSWCDNSPAGNDFHVRLVCSGLGWRLDYGAGEIIASAPCSGSVLDPGAFVCRPIYFRVEVDGACCGPSAIPNPTPPPPFLPPPPQSLIFTITE